MAENKSILNQLKKYGHSGNGLPGVDQPKPMSIVPGALGPPINAKEIPAPLAVRSNDLVRQGGPKKKTPPIHSMDPKEIAEWLGIDPRKLFGITPYPFTGILYPFALLCIYHLTLIRQTYLYDGEARCDELLTAFIQDRIETIGSTEYFKFYRQATTPKTQRLVMLRILVATFEFGYKKLDNLPSSHKETACNFLELPLDIKLTEAQELLERELRLCAMEELILGRIGYLIIWKELAGSDYNFVAENMDKVEVIVEPTTGLATGPDNGRNTKGVTFIDKSVPRDARGLPIDRTIIEEWWPENKERDTEQDIVEGDVPGID